MATSLLDLSDELLAQILDYALQYEPPSTSSSAKLFTYPKACIASKISINFRQLLRPMRCCRKIYSIARHEFLEANVILLQLSELETSAMALETPSMRRRNPSFLLRSLVHAQLQVSISDMRAPFTKPFLSGDHVALYRETEGLKQLPLLCPSLKTAHFFMKIDEWMLYGIGPVLRRNGDSKMSEKEERYRRHLEKLMEDFRQLPYRVVTVAFHHWRGDLQTLDMQDAAVEDVVDTLLMPTIDETWEGPMARIR